MTNFFDVFITGYMENKTRIPQQERSKETKQNILKAGLTLFSEKGFYKTNSKEIAREAGVSIGSFYLYFKNKKDLFKELLLDYHKKIHSVLEDIEIETFIKAGERKEFLRYLINKLIESHEIYPQFHQEIHVMAQSDPEFSKIIEFSKTLSYKITKSMMAVWKEQLRIENIDAAAIVVQTSTEEIVHKLLFSLSKRQGKKVIDELTDMLYRYLFNDST